MYTLNEMVLGFCLLSLGLRFGTWNCIINYRFTIYSLQMFYFKIVEMLKVRSFSKIIKQYNVSNVYIFVA